MERRLSETESADCYKLLSENTRDVILFIGSQGRIIEVNNAAIYTYGYTRDELLNMCIKNLCTDQMQCPITHHAYQEETFIELLHLRKDGSSFPVEMSIQKASLGEQTIILSIVRDITGRKQNNKWLQDILTYDALTGIPNRYYLEKVLQEMVEREQSGALLFIDIDNFKVINNAFGPATGDQLLITLVQVFRANIGEENLLVRLGGDEFAILIDAADFKEAAAMAEELRKALEENEICLTVCKTCFNLTLSIGIVMVDGTLDPQRVLSYADTALYAAKEEGKNRVVSIRSRDDERLLSKTNQLVTKIKNAVQEDQFVLYFQPVYRLGGSIMHHEALIRLLNDDGNLIPPGVFIPIAESFGLMSLIDRWVVQEALRILKANSKAKLFVNLSAMSLGDRALLEHIEISIKDSGIDPARLGFEITETTAIRDMTQAEKWIRRLKLTGCNFALDDFGVGFTSFSHLQQLPVDFLKIDGSFVKNVDTNPAQKALLHAMNTVAHALGKETIAEFVETQAVVHILQELNIDCGQGYFLGKPSPYFE